MDRPFEVPTYLCRYLPCAARGSLCLSERCQE